MKKISILLIMILLPLNIFAYSNEVILGGHTIGIDVKMDGVLVVGFYKINGSYNETTPLLKEGDYIISVNNQSIKDINEMSTLINKYSSEGFVQIKARRNGKTFETKLNLIEDNNIYKTGIYVKDSITGIGTLTFIDPATMVYGALGHEIIESNTYEMVDIINGTIFENNITSINKSKIGVPGSKNATFSYDNTYGTVYTNTNKGIYGQFTSTVSDYELVEVATKDEIKIGPALIYTVTDKQKIETYDINITKINESSETKNFTIEITDKELLDLTGGVVQGMSGSPIIQNNKIIGAVTHVIVDNPKNGYGIFIENMLNISDHYQN